jgi:hypothetical protein
MPSTSGGSTTLIPFTGKLTQAPQSGNATQPAITGETKLKLIPAVTASDQTINDSIVIVANVVSPGPGWLVIHNEQNGVVGWEIGYAALKSGENANVRINIDMSQATPTLFAVLHADAGEVGKFEFPGPDGPILLNGQILSLAFKALNVPDTSSALAISGATESSTNTAGQVTTGTPQPGGVPMIKVSNQRLTNGMLKVDQVDSSGPGWVVVYTLNTDGQPDQPIGRAMVKDGESHNVMVPVDSAMAKGKLYVQLHKDAGIEGTFEYPGPDEPVLNNLVLVSSLVEITPQPTQPTATSTSQSDRPAATHTSTAAPVTETAPPPVQATETPSPAIATVPPEPPPATATNPPPPAATNPPPPEPTSPPPEPTNAPPPEPTSAPAAAPTSAAPSEPTSPPPPAATNPPPAAPNPPQAAPNPPAASTSAP